MTTAAPNPYESPQTAEMAGSPLTISPTGEIEYSFIITEDDWIALSSHALNTSSAFRKRINLVRLMFAFVMVSVGLMGLWRDASVFFNLATIMFISAAILVLIPHSLWQRFNLHFTRKVIREGQNRSIFGPHRVRINRREVANFHEFGYSAIYWPAVERVETTPKYLFIFVSSLSAHILPLRDLRTEQDRQTFIDTVTRYFQDSRAGGPVARGA